MENDLHKGHRKRLRELAYNNEFKNLQEHQVLELLLSYVIPRKDTNPIAHNLINEFGSFANVLDADFEDLIKVDGIGEKTAYFLCNIKYFLFYYNKTKDYEIKKINTIGTAVKCAKNLLAGKNNEEFYTIYLDANNNVKQIECINSGTETQTYVNLTKITKSALKNKAVKIIVCHNHPTGDAVPSKEDNKLTNALIMSLFPNNISVLDHIIIGVNNYYSYHNSGMLNKLYSMAEETFEFKVAMPNKFEFNAEMVNLEDSNFIE